MTSRSHVCPVCKNPTLNQYRPFCSQRCADIDLGKWFSGQYFIPGEKIDPEECEKNKIITENVKTRVDPDDSME